MDPAVTRTTLDGAPPRVGERIDAWASDVVLRDPELGLGAHLVLPGDLDGDGVDDLVVSGGPVDEDEECSPGVRPPVCAALRHEELRIYYGGPRIGRGGPDAVLVTPSLPGYSIRSASAHDVDGDGLADLVVGLDVHAGPAAVSLVYGGPRRSGVTPLQAAGPVFRDDSVQTRLMRVAGVGDLDGDGLDDLALGGDFGAPLYLLYGRRERWGGAVHVPDVASATLRLSVAALDPMAVGDLDGDMLDDVVVQVSGLEGAPEAPAYRIAGAAERIEGAHDLREVATSLRGVEVILGALGDLDGDGRAELGVEALDGHTLVVAGRAAWPDGLDLSRRAQARLLPPPELVEDRGVAGCRSMARGGDVTGDGLPDVLCGHWAAYVGGATYVVPGRVGGLMGDVPLAEDAVAFIGRHLPGEFLDGEGTGEEVRGGSDLNGDGIDDFVFSATFFTEGWIHNGGTCHLVFGWRADR